MAGSGPVCVPAPRRAAALTAEPDPRGRPLLRRPSPPVEIFLWSRAAVWAALVFVLLVAETEPRLPNLSGLTPPDAPPGWRPPWLDDLGWAVDVWARWDSAWFLRIAEHGYAAAANTAAFFPLYPGLVGVLGRLLGGHFIAAGVLVSTAASLVSFVLLHRLAAPRVGDAAAARAVLYLAVFPFPIFLQAVYSEPLFLALALATFLLAERGRFVAAATACGLALLTRPFGLALVPALAVFAWRAPGRGRALAALLLVPLLFAAYPLALAWQLGEPFAFLRAELDPIWAREPSPLGPLGGVVEGVRAAAEAAGDVAAGRAPPGTSETATAVHEVEALAFALLFLVLTAVAWRRLGAPYGVYAATSLAIPLSIPSERLPLLSLPRFCLVLFPCFLALALLARRPGVHAAVVAISSLLLGIVLVRWALWLWVS